MSDPEEPQDPRVVRTRADVLRAAVSVLLDEGPEGVTQPRVARAAGYAKATVYAHWPERVDLLRDAFLTVGRMPHHEPTGDLRADLLGELQSFRRAMVEHRLDRVLAVLAERTASTPELVEVRDAFVDDGESPLRALLSPHLSDDRLSAATLMLNGAVLHGGLLRGAPPADAVLEAAVDAVLVGFDLPRG
jgi:AcrR family transcriptional regulator